MAGLRIRELDRFAADTVLVLGHNLLGHDLSPLAFPENPSHRLVKDYKLVRDSGGTSMAIPRTRPSRQQGHSICDRLQFSRRHCHGVTRQRHRSGTTVTRQRQRLQKKPATIDRRGHMKLSDDM